MYFQLVKYKRNACLFSWELAIFHCAVGYLLNFSRANKNKASDNFPVKQLFARVFSSKHGLHQGAKLDLRQCFQKIQNKVETYTSMHLISADNCLCIWVVAGTWLSLLIQTPVWHMEIQQNNMFSCLFIFVHTMKERIYHLSNGLELW